MKIDDYCLVDLEKKHLDIILKWRNSDRIRLLMYNDQLISLDEHINWYNSIRSSEQIVVKLLLYLGKPIGLVNFSKISTVHKSCYWGFYIGEEDTPKGVGTILGYLALEYIFEIKNMRKVCAEIIGYNTQSIKFHQKMGFLEEGRLIDHIYKQGQLVDIILMAQFKRQWISIKNDLSQYLGGILIDEQFYGRRGNDW